MAKRIKKSFGNLEKLAQAWVNPERVDAKTGLFREEMSSLYCRNGRVRDGRIYSYGNHFLLGALGLKINGVAIGVVSYSSYSSTTSGHSSDVSSALRSVKALVLKSQARWTSETTDQKIIDDCLEALKIRAEELGKEVAIYEHNLKDIKKSIQLHNKLVSTLKLGKAYLATSAVSAMEHKASILKHKTSMARRRAVREFESGSFPIAWV